MTSAEPSSAATPYDNALCAALTTEHAVIYGYGMVSAHCQPDVNGLVSSALNQLRAFILEWCRARGLIAPGDRIVGIRGSLPDDPTHNEIVVLEVP